MRIFLLIFVFLAFLQSAFLPVNLVLVTLIARSFAVTDRTNLWLAFLGGLILSFLTQTNLGYYPLIFLIIVKLNYVLKNLPISFSPLMIFLLSVVLISISALFNKYLTFGNWDLYSRLFEAVIILPVFYAVRFWEDRFLPKKAIKLKV